MRVILPWPTADLSPNSRGHWAVKARAKKAYRMLCAWEAQSQGIGLIYAERLHVKITFVPPNRRARDLDNLLASIKSGLDGLCDVVGVDDSKWALEISKANDRIGGFVEIVVTAA